MTYDFSKYEFFIFPLKYINEYFYEKGKKISMTNEGKNTDIEIYECFEYFQKTEFLTGDNQFYCNKCKKCVDGCFFDKIYSLPFYLIIILRSGNKDSIYECKVNFPEQLNLSNYVISKNYTKYELYAVLCFLKKGKNGNFVAYCRNRMDNKWYLYDDANVTPCTKPQQYNEGVPYVLFYSALNNN